MAQIGFHADESAETYCDLFSAFHSICKREPPVVIVDKDFVEIDSLRKVFPNSRIILCVFHVKKWMKGVIATVHGPKFEDVDRAEKDDEKDSIMDAFDEMLYARTEDIYLTKQAAWNKVIEGVDVKLGAGKQQRFTSLREYFDKCWAPVCDMWAMYARAKLPLGDENTNNRVERAFRTMKELLRMHFAGRIDIEKAVPCLIAWVEDQLEGRYTEAQCHSIRLSDPDPELDALYMEAGKHLSYHACRQLKVSVELLKKLEVRMKVLESGEVEETIKKNTVVLRQTSENECSCTYFAHHRCPCRHILLLRKVRGLPLFDLSLYPLQHLAARRHDVLQEGGLQEELGAGGLHSMAGEVDQEEEEEVRGVKVLSGSQKHNILFPKLQRLSNMICSSFGTEAFLSYVNEFDVVERRVRSGQLIFPLEDSEVNGEDNEATVGELKDEPEVADSDKNLDEGEGQVKVEAQTKHNILFQAKAKSKGRPRGSVTKATNFKKKNNKKQAAKAETDEEELVETSIAGEPSEVYVCVAPGWHGQWGENMVTLREYASLAPRKFVFDTVMNWWLRVLQYQHVVLDKKQQEVLLLSTEFAVKLGQPWRWEAGEEPSEELLNWTDDARLWEEGGCRLVMLTACVNHHYYALVALLDKEQPELFVLESLGGDYSRTPPCAAPFCAFLLSLRARAGVQGPEFVTSTPPVPRQLRGSNDCALFCCQFVEKILQSPIEFENRAKRNDLTDWFEVEAVKDKREQLAAQISQMALDQRQPNGQLEGRPLQLPLLAPSVVDSQVETLI